MGVRRVLADVRMVARVREARVALRRDCIGALNVASSVLCGFRGGEEGFPWEIVIVEA